MALGTKSEHSTSRLDVFRDLADDFKSSSRLDVFRDIADGIKSRSNAILHYDDRRASHNPYMSVINKGALGI